MFYSKYQYITIIILFIVIIIIFILFSHNIFILKPLWFVMLKSCINKNVII